MPIPDRAEALRTLGRIDKHLSEAQKFTAEIANMETREGAPALFAVGDKAWDDIEKIRRRLRDFAEGRGRRRDSSRR